MPSAYIKQLSRQIGADDAQHKDAPRTLDQKFIEWFDNLPEIGRDRPFAMAELEKALGTQGKYLSPILISLGWKRKRKWTSAGQYHRYWEPPRP